MKRIVLDSRPRVDRKPKAGNDHSAEYDEFAAPVSECRAGGDCERSVGRSADDTVRYFSQPRSRNQARPPFHGACSSEVRSFQDYICQMLTSDDHSHQDSAQEDRKTTLPPRQSERDETSDRRPCCRINDIRGPVYAECS